MTGKITKQSVMAAVVRGIPVDLIIDFLERGGPDAAVVVDEGVDALNDALNDALQIVGRGVVGEQRGRS